MIRKLEKKDKGDWVKLYNGYADFYKKDVTINVLGPVGDKVEEWTGKGAYITSADFGAIDWTATNAVNEITMEIQCDYWILQF